MEDCRVWLFLEDGSRTLPNNIKKKRKIAGHWLYALLYGMSDIYGLSEKLFVGYLSNQIDMLG